MVQGLAHNHLYLSIGMCHYASLTSSHLLKDVEGEKGLGPSLDTNASFPDICPN